MIRSIVSSNFPSSTVDGGRFVARLVSNGRDSRVLAVDERAAASRRPGPRRLRPRPWCLVGAPARRRRRGALRRHRRAEHAADPPRVAPDRCYGRVFPLDQCSDVRRHRNFQLLVLLADRALLRTARRGEALGSWCGYDPRDAGVVGLPPTAHRHGVAGLEVDAVRAVRAAVRAAARVPLRAAAVAHAVWEAARKELWLGATASRVSKSMPPLALSLVVHLWCCPRVLPGRGQRRCRPLSRCDPSRKPGLTLLRASRSGAEGLPGEQSPWDPSAAPACRAGWDPNAS